MPLGLQTIHLGARMYQVVLAAGGNRPSRVLARFAWENKNVCLERPEGTRERSGRETGTVFLSFLSFDGSVFARRPKRQGQANVSCNGVAHRMSDCAGDAVQTDAGTSSWSVAVLWEGST